MMPPHARLLLRATSIVFHAICGGMAVVCLRYAVVLSDNPVIVKYLLKHGLIFGSIAVAIVYLKSRYLDA